LVLLEDVDGQNGRAGGNLARPVVEERGLVERELADLEAHVKHSLV